MNWPTTLGIIGMKNQGSISSHIDCDVGLYKAMALRFSKH